jgi:hypothetical protein
LAEQYGWSLEYVDSLSLADMEEYFQIQDGTGKARSELRERNAAKKKGR